MANWTQAATQTNFDTQQYADTLTSSRGSQRSGSGLSSGFFGMGGNLASSSYSVVGINTNEVPNMRAAIRNYVQKIYDHLNTINATTDPTIALKGTGIEPAIQEYIASVARYCGALSSTLLAFSDKLAKVQEAWEASDAATSGSVSSSAEETNSTANNAYTEQF